MRFEASGVSKMVRSFRDLIVWQRSIQMSVAVYRLTEQFPKEELYGITSQMRRATVSVASNIAEGHGRLNKAEYRQFLGIARGSNFELQTQLEIAREMKMGDSKALAETEGVSHEVGKMIFGILEAFKAKSSEN
ncbi:MAG: four helix bundle protein [Terracidiphilus sp.]